MQQTENYALNQWNPEDRILRTDFNSDNKKIDDAITALRRACFVEKVKEYHVGSDTRKVDISFSGIDMGQYSHLTVFFQGGSKTVSTERIFVEILCNNLSSAVYRGTNGHSRNSLLSFPLFGGTITGSYQLEMVLGSAIVARSLCGQWVNSNADTAYLETDMTTAFISGSNLQSLNFLILEEYDGTIPAGSTILVYGLRK